MQTLSPILSPVQSTVRSCVTSCVNGGFVGFTGLLDLYGGAAAAYSLRALTRGWLAGDVVEVRRSSDSTSLPFTAGQVTGGAMLDFVASPDARALYGSTMYWEGGSDDRVEIPFSSNFFQWW